MTVKTTTHPSTGDLASMYVFPQEYADHAPAGLLLHTGEQTFWIARNVLTMPWWKVIWNRASPVRWPNGWSTQLGLAWT